MVNDVRMHSCHRPRISQEDTITGIKIEPSLKKTKTQRLPYSPLKIHFHYTDSFNNYVSAETLKRQIFEPARIDLELMLTVKNPTNGILRVDRSCNGSRAKAANGEIACSANCSTITQCGGFDVPEMYLNRCKVISANGEVIYSGIEGAGVLDIDIVLYVVVQRCGAGLLASALSCFQESELDRPILGVIITCDGVFQAGKNILNNRVTVQHEIIHNLGFSSEKFAFYRYQNGFPIVQRDSMNLPNLGYNSDIGAYIWNDYIIKQVTRNRTNIHETYSKLTFGIVLPTVLSMAQTYFACPTLDGVDLEDFPEISHFSEYILYNEMMTPIGNGNLDKMSIFTLALLKDSGWYDVVFDKGSTFTYGKDAGCTIVVEGCYKYMQNQKALNKSILPFCDRIVVIGDIFRCPKNRQYFYFCSLEFNKNLPRKFQYFKKLKGVPDNEAPFYAGVSKNNEYCPSMVLTSDPSSFCIDEENRGKRDSFNLLTSYFGPDSLCFLNGIYKSVKKIYYGASCQKYFHDKKRKILKIFFSDKTVQCPSDKIFYINGNRKYTATFECPDLKDFENFTVITTDKVGSRLEVTALGMKIICLIVIIYYAKN